MKAYLNELYKNNLEPWKGQNETQFDVAVIKKISDNASNINKVCVVGCGDGVFAKKIADTLLVKNSNAIVYASDISVEAVNKAKSLNCQSNIKYDVSNVLDLTGKYDLVFERNLLHFFVSEQERQLYFLNIAHMLDSGSNYYGLTFDVDNPNCDPVTHIGKSQYFPDGIRYSTKEEIIKLVEPYFIVDQIYNCPIDVPTVGHNFTRKGLAYELTRL